MEGLKPWEACAAEDAEALERELLAEVGRGHVLCEMPVRAAGRRVDCDDGLFELLDGSGRVVVVHLPYARRPEVAPDYPWTEVLAGWEAFAQRMREEVGHH